MTLSVQLQAGSLEAPLHPLVLVPAESLQASTKGTTDYYGVPSTPRYVLTVPAGRVTHALRPPRSTIQLMTSYVMSDGHQHSAAEADKQR